MTITVWTLVSLSLGCFSLGLSVAVLIMLAD